MLLVLGDDDRFRVKAIICRVVLLRVDQGS
jgi:hypothetical protein